MVSFGYEYHTPVGIATHSIITRLSNPSIIIIIMHPRGTHVLQFHYITERIKSGQNGGVDNPMHVNCNSD